MIPNIDENQIEEAIQSTLNDFVDDADNARLRSDAAAYVFLTKVVMQRLPAASISDGDVIHRLFLRFAEHRMRAMLAGDMTHPLAKLPAFVDIVGEAVELGARLATSVHTARPLADNLPQVFPAKPKFSVEVS